MTTKHCLTSMATADSTSTIARENKRRRLESQRPLPVISTLNYQPQLPHNTSIAGSTRNQATSNSTQKSIKVTARSGKQARIVPLSQSYNNSRVQSSNCENKNYNNGKTSSFKGGSQKAKGEGAAVPTSTNGGSCQISNSLLTPNRKIVDIAEFMLSVDSTEVTNQNQARSHAAYRAELDRRMMDLETTSAKRDEWFLCFGCVKGGEGCSLEACRLEGIKRYFQYGRALGLRPQTLHLSVHTLGRLFSHLVVSKALTQEMVVGCIASAWRMAVKMNEVPHVAYKACLSRGIKKNLIFLDLPEMNDNEFDNLVSRVETHCADVLQNDVTIPFTLDFLDRFLDLGGWPQDQATAYRELGQFLVSICLFDTKTRAEQEKNNLAGTVPSQVATAALVLAVKIINTDANMIAYDFYPQLLEEYTGYTMKSLKPTIRGISQLLREKPKQCEVLNAWFPNWAVHDWR